MAVDVDLLPSTSLNNIDTNFERVEAALQDVVGRSGTLPNQMNADLDMNSNDILNVKSIDTDILYINGEPVIPDTLVTLAPNSVGSDQIIDGSVNTVDLADGAVTLSKIASDVLIPTPVRTLAEFQAAIRGTNSIHISPSLTSITLVSEDVPFFLDKLPLIRADVLTTINLPSGTFTTTAGPITTVSDANANIRIIGADTVDTTHVSVASVTGSSGDWTVVHNITLSTGMAIGDVADFYNIGPLPILSGDNSAGTILRDYPVKGEIYAPVLNTGTITAASGGGSASFTGTVGTLSDYIQPGDLITFGGQTRVVATVGASSITIVGAWAAAITASRAFWLTRPNTGTAGTTGSSTTIALTGGAATTEANVGDMILVDGQTRRIETINSNIEIIVDEVITITGGTSYSIITGAALHWGPHEITAVGVGTITVKNRSFYKPPVNQVGGGEVVCFKTILKQSGVVAGTDDGITFSQNGAISEIDQIAVVGTRTSNTMGMFVGSRISADEFGDRTQRNYNANGMLGPKMSFVNWGGCIWVGIGCGLDARSISVSGALETSVVFLEGSHVNHRRAVIVAGSSRGVQINPGAVCLGTEILIAGHGDDAITRYDGATFYTEVPMIWANAGMNSRVIGPGGWHVNEGISALAGQSGMRYEAAGGETKRMLILCAKRIGLEADGLGHITGDESWITGTSNASGNGHGVSAIDARIDLDGAGINGSSGQDVYVGRNAIISLDGAELSTLTVADGGSAFIPNVSPIPTLTGVLHVAGSGKDGSKVSNGVDDYQTYTSAVTASSGTITSATNTAKFREILGEIHFECDATITNNGTGAGSLLLGLPFSATGNYPIEGYNIATGDGLQGYTSGANAVLFKGAAVYPVSTGDRIIVKGIYR